MRLFLIIIFFIWMLFFSGFGQNIYSAAPAVRSTIWESTTIPVCWENPTSEDEIYREMVQNEVRDTWEKYSQLKFTGWKSCRDFNTGIRIKIEDDVPHTKGLGNELDKKPNGMVLNFTFEKWTHEFKKGKEFSIKAIAVHEFGHAIGFAHEEKNDSCYYPNNCLDKNNGRKGDMFVSDCDINSVMNYCNPKYLNDGILSEKDIELVQNLYGPPSELHEENVTRPFEIFYSSKQIGNLFGKRAKKLSSIFLTGSNYELNQIEKVVYLFNSKDNEKQITTTNYGAKFGAYIKVKDQGKIDVSARIFKKDGTKILINKQLSY